MSEGIAGEKMDQYGTDDVPSKLVFSDLSPTDASALSQLHSEVFRGFFLTSFGGRFMTRFYGSLLRQPWGFGVGLMEGGRCAAFAVGSLGCTRPYRELVKADAAGLLWAAFPVVMRHPGRLWRVARAIGGRSYASEPHDAILCSICVSSGRQGTGVGSALIGAFERRAEQEQCRGVVLTTDVKNNQHANRFYRANGYQVISTTVVTPNRPMHCYRKGLGRPSPAPIDGTEHER